MTALQQRVKEIILDKVEENYTVKDWYKDFYQGGCISGFVGELIYYADTEKFYNTYAIDIENLVNKYHNDISSSSIPRPTGNYDNDAAWFAFESVAIELEGSI